MEVLVLFIMIISLLLIGVPIAVSLGLSSMIFLLVMSDTSLESIAQSLYQAMAGHYTLLAIPFFILASSFMSTGGVAQRIIRFAIACVGHLQGGLAIAGVMACMIFAALSGSSPATVVAIGSIVIAAMTQAGYTKEFAAGVICNAGTLGILIPPSIVMVVYASATDVSVGRMFLAGVIPGLLAGVMLMITIYVMARIKNMPKGEWLGWGEIFSSFRDALWGLMLIVIIMGGIYGHPWIVNGALGWKPGALRRQKPLLWPLCTLISWRRLSTAIWGRWPQKMVARPHLCCASLGCWSPGSFISIRVRHCWKLAN